MSFRVTGRALLAVASLMRIILSVARDAPGRQFLFVEKSGMTALALNEAVLALERILRGPIMIE